MLAWLISFWRRLMIVKTSRAMYRFTGLMNRAGFAGGCLV
jgi:hypothetical protein